MSTILIAEDYEALRMLFTRLFASEGFTVEAATNGITLVQRAIRLQPDVILTDIHLPGLSGLDAITYLLSDTRTRHIPIVALCCDPTNECGALAGGAQAFFLKPVSIDELLATVHTLITK
jgi:two-component system, cell cycle response regulator DivK